MSLTEEQRLDLLEQERRELFERLGTGPTQSDLEESAQTTFKLAMEALQGEVSVAISMDQADWFAKGCIAILIYANLNTYAQKHEHFMMNEASAWEGPRVVTRPSPRADGSVENDWLLFF